MYRSVGVSLWILLGIALTQIGCARSSDNGEISDSENAILENGEGKPEDKDQPFLAVWRKHEGRRLESDAPYLRFAFWNDGRVLYAKDSEKWNHDLLRGKIEPDKVKKLKSELAKTGVCDLKGYCYLGPSMPCDCVMVDLGKKKQMLYWVEGMMSWMESAPHRMDFVKAWKAVNKLARAASPEHGEPVKERFQQPPASWYLKRAIQS